MTIVAATAPEPAPGMFTPIRTTHPRRGATESQRSNKPASNLPPHQVGGHRWVQLGTRFFRPDTGRGRGKGGFGLGLALTKAYMRVLGGSLEYQPAEPRGSRFTLTLPKG